MTELRHLHNFWDVDRFIVLEETKVVAIRFSAFEAPPASSAKRRRKEGSPEASSLEEDRDVVAQELEHHIATQQMDQVLVEIAPLVRKYCVIYAVDTREVPQFNSLYELHDPSDPFSLMFFYKNKHIKVDVGTGNNNKINFVITEAQDLIDIIEAVFLAGKRGSAITGQVKKFPNAAKRM